MCQDVAGAQALFSFLQVIDGELAGRVKAERCVYCGGPLHAANYKRKPRGFDWLPLYVERRSLCCGWAGCRRRTLPPSVLFLGRRVFLGTVVVLVGALSHKATPSRMRRVRERFGVDRRTVGRWLGWWRATFPRLTGWQAVQALFMPPIDEAELPKPLFARLGGRLLRVLLFVCEAVTDAWRARDGGGAPGGGWIHAEVARRWSRGACAWLAARSGRRDPER